MTLNELKDSDITFLNTSDIAEIVGADPDDIRRQAHKDPVKLGYPVSVCGRRVKIPRLGFLYFIEYGRTVP